MSYEQLIQKGMLRMKQNDLEQAEQFFKEAIKLNPNRTEAYLNLAWIDVTRRQWDDAKNFIQQAFKLEPENLLAHYLNGICDREDGIFDNPFTRRILWRGAKNHFLKVIEQDSLYEEVFNEYAHLKRYQGKYEEAIDLCLTQLRLRPQAAKPARDIFEFYDFYLAHGGDSLFNIFTDRDNHQINWLKKRHSDYDCFFLGEKYRRMERFKEADSIFLALFPRKLHFAKVPILLAQVRLLYQMNKPDTAETCYWAALDSARNLNEFEFIIDDLKYILSDKEFEIRFDNIRLMRAWITKLWDKFNPITSLKNNIRLEEHYNRLVYAEKYYRYDGFELAYYNTNRFDPAGNPEINLSFPAIYSENKKLNDMGIVYVRYGPPDESITSANEMEGRNESWRYFKTNQNKGLIFHFATKAPANWQLVTIPSPGLLHDIRGWDRDLDNYFYKSKSSTKPWDVSKLSATMKYQDKLKDTYKIALDNQGYSLNEKITTIPVYICAAKFLDEKGNNSIEFYIGAQKSELFSKRPSTEKFIRFETGLAVEDTLYNVLFKTSNKLQLAKNDSTVFFNEYYIDRIPAKLSPMKKVYITTHIKDLDQPLLGGYQYNTEITSISRSKLAISDLILAYRITPTTKVDKFTRHELQIIPNPTQKFKRSETVNVYYEIYHLGLKAGRTDFNIEQIATQLDEKKDALGKITQIFGKKRRKSISINAERQVESSTSCEHTAFDFSEFNPGRIELKIKVFDLNSKQRAESRIEFELY